jgi:hypothetical protein
MRSITMTGSIELITSQGEDFIYYISGISYVIIFKSQMKEGKKWFANSIMPL